MNRAIGTALTLICAAAATKAQEGGTYDRHAAAIAAGHRALFTCSALFNAGQSEAQIERDIFTPLGRTPPHEPLEPDIDVESKTVSVAYAPDMPPRIADFGPDGPPENSDVAGNTFISKRSATRLVWSRAPSAMAASARPGRQSMRTWASAPTV